MSSKTVRKCIVASCSSTVGLHGFPEDLEVKRMWVRALRLSDGDNIPPGFGVCSKHFTRDSFSNYVQFNMGFIKQLYLKSTAVPILQQQQGFTLLSPNLKREIGCQTDPVLTKYASVQVDLKPAKRNKAIQARAPSRTVCCYTETFTELSLPQSTTSPVKKVRRQRGGASADDSSSHQDAKEPTAPLMTSFSDVAPWAQDQTDYVVEEEQLLELFGTCPLCKQSCTVENTTTGTLVHINQQCNHCEFTNKWCSQPLANNPEGDDQPCAEPLSSGSTGPQTSAEKQT
ncbi:uncharacterized protein LOC106524202 [Austrofundulus limnaeus]|uniref:Uncharacterized protein LOC106524202 n=1 Tax=Austrofundulus limnaeus TaxID=52670 RepID=A0A2I4C048_AUSLI|nr:PREDICTED: uncharacterized protein LOC106524202 [Austrofundulus limnaeus]